MSLEQEIVKHGAPTLAGMKTGSLFPVASGREDIRPEIRRLNRMLSKKGVCLLPLRRTDKNTLIYLYRPGKLSEDFKDGEVAGILCEKGYPCECPNRCIAKLIRHLTADETFPHEIGLFLGYPPADVRGFMENSRCGVKCTGCWKVYGNPEEARKTFRKYKKCTHVYRKVFQNGRSLKQMTVNTRQAG